MTEASAYVLEEIGEQLEQALKRLQAYLRKSSRAISAKRDFQEYESSLSAVRERLERTALEYPGDEELGRVSSHFSKFYLDRHALEPKAQRERVDRFVSDLKSMAHWRKMETAYGRSLGFSDFRSLRGESKKR